MILKVLLPSEEFLHAEATKVIAEAENGYFCLLPRHVDFVAALVPGLLFYDDPEGAEHFLSIDEGALVKCGEEVLVCTRHAVSGGALGELQQIVREQFEVLDDRERASRSAAAQLESGMVRRFMEFERHGP
jgi:F-type H+-transporting ATPase subunit epsilon